MTRNQRHVVGIFSRDGEDNYKWLINLLRTEIFQSIVEVVLPIHISNDTRSFNRGLTESSFAIVYHTKNRGRLNIANVTDSLYDEELEELARHLGRSNVIVVGDDLEDSSDNTLRTLLHEQRLDEYVCKLILISKREKESSNLNGEDPKYIPSLTSAQMQDAYNTLHDKLLSLRCIMENAPHNHTDSHDVDTYDRTSPSYNSRSKGHTGSLVTSTDAFRSHDMRRDDQKSLLDGNSHNNPPGQSPILRNNTDGQAKKNKKKEKMVFGVTGALIAALVVVLIVVLCVGL